MYLQSIASAFPPAAFTQKDCWSFIQASEMAKPSLRSRSMSLLEKILTGDSGIDRRHLYVEDPTAIFTRSAQELNQDFERHAPLLSGEALSEALEKAGLHADEIDALFICTCTGYLCPGVTSHLAEQLGMRPDVYLQDLVGLGCGAAVPLLRSAQGFLAANPDAVVATVAVEICSAAFYMDDDPGVLISLCLFGDGASASIWKNTPPSEGDSWKAGDFCTLHVPEEREKIRFINEAGKLKNKLHRSVPEVAAGAVNELYASGGHNGSGGPHVLAHPGGRDVIEAIENKLPIAQLPESRTVLRNYGNLSSPSVLVALEKYLEGDTASDHLWLTAFGAGFACHSLEINRES